jgi:triacylglycerol lipase
MSHFPIILVHGILGFDKFAVANLQIDYFRGIREALVADGHDVPEPPTLNPTASVQDRAAELKDFVMRDQNVAGRPVHILAHSMAGLDARYMISRLNMAERVLTLTTLGAPHRGTIFADKVLRLSASLLQVFHKLADIPIQGFFDLTVRNCAEFSQAEVPDAPGVCYFSVVGRFEPALLDVLKIPHDLVFEREGPNDGLVSVQSATFGRLLETWPVDHFRLINWPTNIIGPLAELEDPFVINRYRALAQGLAGAA